MVVLFDTYVNQSAECINKIFLNIRLDDETACSQIELMLLTSRLS